MIMIKLNLTSTHSFSRRLRATTETLEAAIAADAIQGLSSNPTGIKTPAAMGIPAKREKVC